MLVEPHALTSNSIVFYPQGYADIRREKKGCKAYNGVSQPWVSILLTPAKTKCLVWMTPLSARDAERHLFFEPTMGLFDDSLKSRRLEYTHFAFLLSEVCSFSFSVFFSRNGSSFTQSYLTNPMSSVHPAPLLLAIWTWPGYTKTREPFLDPPLSEWLFKTFLVFLCFAPLLIKNLDVWIQKHLRLKHFTANARRVRSPVTGSASAMQTPRLSP